jgi:predicted MFS family arabinose efflux permease
VAGGLAWYLPWRGLAGVAGGVLMALAGPATQAQVLPSRRGTAGGVVIGGVAGGVSLAALAVPAFLFQGMAAAWLGLAAIILLLWALAHRHWPNAVIANPRSLPGGARPRARLLLLAYGLSGAGLVPPMVYLADLAARGRGLGVGLGSAIWFLFGIGGMLGAVLLGRVADRAGGGRAIQLALVAQVLALGLALPPWAPLLVPASLLSGFAGVGVTASLLATARERAGAAAGWLFARGTVVFGIAQTVTAFALAAVFAATGESHAAVFGAGLALSVAALVVALWPEGARAKGVG